MSILRRLAPARGIIAALLVFVASSATNMAPHRASESRHDDLAVQTAPVLHAPLVQRVGQDTRSQRRVPPPTDLPFAAEQRVASAWSVPLAIPRVVEQLTLARVVPRAYDATAPPVES